MATWKEMRALEAAARAAEAQRQAESARGARELRGLERFLGSVDQLIGMAPGAIEGYQAGEAQKVLAGERPLEQPAPQKGDILQETGAFISGLFEPGVREKVAQMAPEKLAKDRETMKPLTTQEVTKGLAGKYEQELGVPLPPEMGAKRAATDVMEKIPAAKFVPEAQREALSVGDVQRVQAEQAAAAREQELFDLKKKEVEAKIAPKGGELPSRKNLIGAAKNIAIGEAANLESQINIVGDQEVTKQTFAQVRSVAEDAYRKAGGDPTSQDGMSDVFSIAESIYSKYRKKDFGVKDYDLILTPMNLNDELVELDDLRKKVNFSPGEAQIVRQRIANADLKSFIVDIGEINRLINDLQIRGEITPDQAVYLNLSLQAKNALIKAANDGYNVTNSDFSRLNSIVLDPMSSDEVWDGILSGTLRKINRETILRYNVISSTVTAPAGLASRISKLETPEIKLTGSKEKLSKESSKAAGEAVQQIIEWGAKTGAQAMGLPALLDLASKQEDGVLKKAAETVKSFFGMDVAALPAVTTPTLAAPAAATPAVPAAPTVKSRPAPPPGEYEAPEVAYQRLKQGGQLEGRRIMLIITPSNGNNPVYGAVANTQDAIDSLTARLRQKDPNVKTEVYTGNDAGGL